MWSPQKSELIISFLWFFYFGQETSCDFISILLNNFCKPCFSWFFLFFISTGHRATDKNHLISYPWAQLMFILCSRLKQISFSILPMCQSQKVAKGLDCQATSPDGLPSHCIFFIPLWFCLFKRLKKLSDRVLSWWSKFLIIQLSWQSYHPLHIFMTGKYYTSAFPRHLKSTHFYDRQILHIRIS